MSEEFVEISNYCTIIIINKDAIIVITIAIKIITIAITAKN